MLRSPLLPFVASQSGRVSVQFTEVGVMTLLRIIKEYAGNCFFWLVGTPRIKTCCSIPFEAMLVTVNTILG